ncbi:MAG: hypothetical protein ACE5O2_08495, partial [Armatimonadota bacterium]
RETQMRNMNSVSVVAYVVAAMLCGTGAASGQIDPSLFSLGERLSGFNEPSVRGIGMGGVLTALDSRDPINPAQNAELDGWWGQFRTGWLNTSVGTDIKSVGFKVACPIGSARHPAGLAFHYQTLDSSNRGVNIPMPPPDPSLSVDLREGDWGVSYGRKVGRKVAVGLTIAGDVDVDIDMLAVPGATKLAKLNSGPSAGISGARVGALYTPCDAWRVGLLFSVGGTDVDVTSLFPEPVKATYEFDTWSLRVGAQYKPHARTTLALEMDRGHISGAGSSSESTMWWGGIEQRLSCNLALRIGSADGPFSAGIGYSGDGWGIDYAYVNDRYRDSLSDLYGGSAGNYLAVHKLF